MPHVLVIGGGITGLSAAHRIVETGHTNVRVSLTEASSRLGGAIDTIERDGFLLELGPDSFLTTKPALIDLCRRIGIEDRVTPTHTRFRRSYVVFREKLHPLPDGFLMMAPTRFMPFARSPLFTWTGKFRMAMDLVLPRGGADDESLGAFVVRRMGREALERVVQPLVGGIYTGDPHALSLRATMPRFVEMETKHRSLIIAMWKKRRAVRKKLRGATGDSGVRYGELASFDKGIRTVIDRLTALMPADTLYLGCSVTALYRSGDRWKAVLGNGQTITTDAVVLALPAHRSAELLRTLDVELAAELADIPHASSAIVNMAFRREDIPHPMDGFGFVVPAVERRKIIACSFSHVKFPGRAPEGHALLRVFVGGALQPELFDLDDERLIWAAREDLKALMGITTPPLFTVLSRYPTSMPQYRLGHREKVARIRGLATRHPGLLLAGNAFDGVGLPDCVRSGETAAEEVLKRFEEGFGQERGRNG